MTDAGPNSVLASLDRDAAVTGVWLLSGSVRLAEALARTHLDWIGIDTEHAPYSPERVEAVVRAVEPTATPLVRLPSVDAAVDGATQRALDSGAGGIVVPAVDTPAAAERAVSAATVPPAGTRGIAGTVRANGYGDRMTEYVESANARTLVVIQLESPAAIDRADEILAVDGVDVAFVGENDLSAAIGAPGETDHPAVRRAVERVRATAIEHGVAPGIAARTPDALDRHRSRGFRFFLLGADVTFARAGVERFASP